MYILPGLISYLDDDINNSGVIEYVDLPITKKADEALKEQLPIFMTN